METCATRLLAREVAKRRSWKEEGLSEVLDACLPSLATRLDGEHEREGGWSKGGGELLASLITLPEARCREIAAKKAIECLRDAKRGFLEDTEDRRDDLRDLLDGVAEWLVQFPQDAEALAVSEASAELIEGLALSCIEGGTKRRWNTDVALPILRHLRERSLSHLPLPLLSSHHLRVVHALTRPLRMMDTARCLKKEEKNMKDTEFVPLDKKKGKLGRTDKREETPTRGLQKEPLGDMDGKDELTSMLKHHSLEFVVLLSTASGIVSSDESGTLSAIELDTVSESCCRTYLDVSLLSMMVDVEVDGLGSSITDVVAEAAHLHCVARVQEMRGKKLLKSGENTVPLSITSDEILSVMHLSDSLVQLCEWCVQVVWRWPKAPAVHCVQLVERLLDSTVSLCQNLQPLFDAGDYDLLSRLRALLFPICRLAIAAKKSTVSEEDLWTVATTKLCEKLAQCLADCLTCCLASRGQMATTKHLTAFSAVFEVTAQPDDPDAASLLGLAQVYTSLVLSSFCRKLESSQDVETKKLQNAILHMLWDPVVVMSVQPLALERILNAIADIVMNLVMSKAQNSNDIDTCPLQNFMSQVLKMHVSVAPVSYSKLFPAPQTCNENEQQGIESVKEYFHPSFLDAAISSSLLRLAQNIRGRQECSHVRRVFVRELLAHTVDLGWQAQEIMRQTHSSFDAHLVRPYIHRFGSMLPALASGCQDWLEEDSMPQVRYLWLHLWTLNIASLDFERKSSYTWPESWRDASSALALLTPPLIEAKEQLETQVELELRSLSLHSTSDNGQVVCLKEIAGLDPIFSQNLRSMTPERQVYIYLAINLELLRAISSYPESLSKYMPLHSGDSTLTCPFACAFSLLHSRLSDGETAESKVLRGTVKVAYDTYVSKLLVWKEDLMAHPEDSLTQKLNSALSNFACFLLEVSLHSSRGGSTTWYYSTATNYLARFLESFPELFWDKACWTLILKGSRREELLTEEAHAQSIQTAMSSHTILDVEVWVERIMQVARGSASAFLHELLSTRQELFDLLSNERQRQERKGTASVLDSILSDFVAVQGMRSLFGGKILGAEALLLNPEDFFQELTRVPDKSSLFGATAVLLSCAERLSVETLHKYVKFICEAPIHKSNGSLQHEMLRTCIFCWEWLLAAEVELEPILFAKIVDAWGFVATAGIGVFSGVDQMSQLRPRLLSPKQNTNFDEELNVCAGPSYFSSKVFLESLAAQKDWLEFLEGRWRLALSSSKSSSALVRAMLCRLFQNLLKKPDRIATHSAAVDVLFYLLKIALEAALCGEAAAFMLADRVFAAAFSFYGNGVNISWHGASRKALLCISALEDFVKVLDKFLNWLSCQPNISIVPDSNPLHQGERPSSKNMLVATDQQVRNGVIHRGQLLKLLCQIHLNRLIIWAYPLGQGRGSMFGSTQKALDFRTVSAPEVVREAWMISPRLAVALLVESMEDAAILSAIEPLVVEGRNCPQVRSIPEAAIILAGCKMARSDPEILSALVHWDLCSVAAAMRLLTGKAKASPYIQVYVVRVLLSSPPRDVAFFLPQLIQALRTDVSGYVEDLLLGIAKTDPIFAHRLVWVLGGEEEPPEEAFNPEVKRSGWEPPKDTGLWKIVGRLREKVIGQMTAAAADFFDKEFTFFERVNSISGMLKRYPKEERKFIISQELEKIPVTSDDLYLPTDPNARVISIKCDSGVPLQSAAKVPILAMFNVEKEVEDEGKLMVSREIQGCIFKVGDDCRQDVLALQVIEILKDSFNAAKLDLYLFPYGVLPTGYERGVIELVPSSKSRSALGEMADGGLLDIFKREYGPVGSVSFENARENFMRSSAAYAIASYILQAKDRHNGNILITKNGHMVHIDFGFIFEISPGGNLGFENAAFKLTHEMTQLVDPSGDKKSPEFKRFKAHCIRAFLVARSCMMPILTVVELMENSGLPCFSRGKPVEHLRERFMPGRSDREAAAKMVSIIEDAYDKWTTGFYDMIQYMQQGIPR